MRASCSSCGRPPWLTKHLNAITGRGSACYQYSQPRCTSYRVCHKNNKWFLSRQAVKKQSWLQILHVAQRGNNTRADNVEDRRQVTASHKRGSAAQTGAAQDRKKAKKYTRLSGKGTFDLCSVDKRNLITYLCCARALQAWKGHVPFVREALHSLAPTLRCGA